MVLIHRVRTRTRAENTVRNLRDAVSLKADLVQEFNALFQQALNAKQFEVTSLSTVEEENGADSPSEDTDDDSGDLSRQYQESRYFRVDYSAQSADLIGPNAFWLDYAEHMLQKGGSDAFFVQKLWICYQQYNGGVAGIICHF